jgi:myo-inositol 2-dehydrogenase/D-chiro-inositol 1-dehydrogenase/scyllo-inositol 2-dehydrogenase (NAD+)
MIRGSASQRTLGIGVIGCGSIAQESHLPAINRIPSTRLVAVADVDESRAQLASQKFGAHNWYRDYMDLLESEDVDAVDVCTPTKYHADVVVAAAKAGKHVLCEKPMALSLADADRMIDTCAKYNVKLMVAHSRRFIPRYSIVREIIRGGRIGRPIWATQISRRTIVEPGSWYFDPNMTLGPIAEVGIHEADLLRWILTDDVREVRGIARFRKAIGGVYDQIFAALKFKKGTVASFEVGYVLPKAFPQFTTLEVLGSKGLVSASDNHMNVVTEGAESGISYPLAYSDLLTVNGAYEREIIAFADSVILDKEPPVTGADARAAVEVISAVLKSIQSKRTIKLPLTKTD